MVGYNEVELRNAASVSSGSITSCTTGKEVSDGRAGGVSLLPEVPESCLRRGVEAVGHE